ncbi:transcriptional regulator, MerR family [Treponema primitia ZAS-2]|uniref:Transcriptional regulator, MerR family n=1 Tax=Treponema primitia (strain ATCC BAA-887 / DSM 12427 / ZAS-2) TaxID=545694 RepID=F5YKH0_TREPZ|nr:MerR family transcriptional regulator [Treponema primitia]AEF85703.1 transcriptional regulator, MerR family [Treponema primitia ZAS-2]
MKHSITDVAKVLGLTSSAIRFFEKKGLTYVEREMNGRRFYTETNVLELLDYTNYRSMGFTLKEIAEYFERNRKKGKTREMMIKYREKYKLKALEQAEKYKNLANAIESHLQNDRLIDDLLDKYEFSKPPSMLMLYDEKYGIASKDQKMQLIQQKWIKAMPETRLSVLLYSIETMEARFGLSILSERAENLSLPRDTHVQELSSVSCLHTIIAMNVKYIEEPQYAFIKPLEFVRAHGFMLAGKPWGHILFVDAEKTMGLCLYMELWIPIKL